MPRGCRSNAGVYPRACGGTGFGGGVLVGKAGLSPRVRGNRSTPSDACICWGSIPARAGEPVGAAAGALHRRVYPRACGGTQSIDNYSHNPWGLSPRVRGNRIAVNLAVRDVGSIPARAGEPALDDLDDAGDGSIPARAGEPAAYEQRRLQSEVYPRACGGTRASSARANSLDGLSPRVRGNPCRTSHLSNPGGSIPARAGEPAMRIPIQRSVTVYPRACGGTPKQYYSRTSTTGLSPRVRGNPQQVA